MNLFHAADKGPGPTIRLIVMCLTGLFLFVALAVYPNIRKSAALDRRALELEAEIEKQKILGPLSGQLKEILEKSRHPDTQALAMPAVVPLAQPEIHGVQAMIENIVRECGLRIDVVRPEVNTLIDSTDLMRVYVSVTGDFFEFRRLFLDLEKRLPSLAHVEKVDIDRIEGSQNLKLQLVLWLSKAG